MEGTVTLSSIRFVPGMHVIHIRYDHYDTKLWQVEKLAAPGSSTGMLLREDRRSGCVEQGLRFRREALSRLSPGTGNRPVPGENRQKPDGMALQIQKSGNRFSRLGTGVF